MRLTQTHFEQIIIINFSLAVMWYSYNGTRYLHRYTKNLIILAKYVASVFTWAKRFASRTKWDKLNDQIDKNLVGYVLISIWYSILSDRPEISFFHAKLSYQTNFRKKS